MTLATSVGRDVNYRLEACEAYRAGVYRFLARNQAIVGFSLEVLAGLESSVAPTGLAGSIYILDPRVSRCALYPGLLHFTLSA